MTVDRFFSKMKTTQSLDNTIKALNNIAINRFKIVNHVTSGVSDQASKKVGTPDRRLRPPLFQNHGVRSAESEKN